MSCQTATTVVSSVTVISSPSPYSVLPIFQALNFSLAGAVKPLAARLYLAPLFRVLPVISPVAPLRSYFTVAVSRVLLATTESSLSVSPSRPPLSFAVAVTVPPTSMSSTFRVITPVLASTVALPAFQVVLPEASSTVRVAVIVFSAPKASL